MGVVDFHKLEKPLKTQNCVSRIFLGGGDTKGGEI